MYEVECRLEVCVDDHIPLCLVHSHHETILCYSGVVYKNIDAAESRLYVVDNLVCVVE